VIAVAGLDDECVAHYQWVPHPAQLAARNLFVAEGRLVVRRLLPLSNTPGHRFEGVVESVLVTPTAAAELADLIEAHPHVTFYEVPQAVMNELVGFNIHRGCLAIARRPPTPTLAPATLASARSVVVLEGVNNPDNLGGIVRSAAAFGVDLVVLGPGTGDPLYRKAIRTSMGATLAVPYVNADVWPQAIDTIRVAGLRTIALTPGRDAISLDAIPDDGRGFALLAGAEGEGLGAAALAGADVRVRIPMTGLVDSLNVTTAVSISLYHLCRGSLP
jgi:tRNA G18 (ribose-2'-O)-methylase SpoU